MATIQPPHTLGRLQTPGLRLADIEVAINTAVSRYGNSWACIRLRYYYSRRTQSLFDTHVRVGALVCVPSTSREPITPEIDYTCSSVLLSPSIYIMSLSSQDPIRLYALLPIDTSSRRHPYIITQRAPCALNPIRAHLTIRTPPPPLHLRSGISHSRPRSGLRDTGDRSPIPHVP